MLKLNEIFDFIAKELEKELDRLEVPHLLQSKIRITFYKILEKAIIKYYSG